MANRFIDYTRAAIDPDAEDVLAAQAAAASSLLATAELLYRDNDVHEFYTPEALCVRLMQVVWRQQYRAIPPPPQIARKVPFKKLWPDQRVRMIYADGQPFEGWGDVPTASRKEEERRFKPWRDWFYAELRNEPLPHGERPPKAPDAPTERRVKPHKTLKEARAEWEDKHPFDTPSKGDLAALMGISLSTLKRRLQEERARKGKQREGQ
jgi:hypothetical protein